MAEAPSSSPPNNVTYQTSPSQEQSLWEKLEAVKTFTQGAPLAAITIAFFAGWMLGRRR
jgi:hypothetical protein